ncbi:hypothetical protein ACNJYA_09000 [Bradyrhizobium sp. DASA03068]|uniref:hypothetical protein n=1 Tax=Bradyrhizobium sp. BLXBL-01 TaxID=3395915 RepID=UPI003F72D68F
MAKRGVAASVAASPANAKAHSTERRIEISWLADGVSLSMRGSNFGASSDYRGSGSGDDSDPYERSGVAGDGHTGMGKGFVSLSLQVQEVLPRELLSDHLFCFRARRAIY